MKTKEITINHQRFTLHPCGCVYWTDKKMLLIADVHLGKVSHFRKAGFAVPEETIAANFGKLDKVIEHFAPDTVCFLGDLFHSHINREWDLFTQWLCQLKSDVILVMGNHDILAHSKYCDVSLTLVDELQIDGFLLTHKPETHENLYNFCGHIHPCVRLQGKGRQFLKLPCFFGRAGQMILPAFGEFTGTYEMTPEEGDSIYVLTKDEVLEVLVKGERRAQAK